MTANKVREVVEKYKRFLILLHEPPEKIDIYDRCVKDRSKILRHAHYMLYKMTGLLDENRLEKSFRWLGFVQGCLFSFGLRSLDDLKDDSRERENPNQLRFNFIYKEKAK